MGRWASDSRSRLEQAALELYLERGYGQTTVAEIAARAGLTERTFFRHFADKREVLFGGSGALQDLMTSTVTGAPENMTPLEAVTLGLEAAGIYFGDNSERSRRRQRIIDADAELQARELSKLATLAQAITQALHKRGVMEPDASLSAELGILVFRTAFERWIDPARQRPWAQLIRSSRHDLQLVLAGDSAQPSR